MVSGKVLLGVGADVERIDNDGLTALMMAASRGYSQIVEVLGRIVFHSCC